MGILKYKYKAHKFINYAFYVVVFIVGFLLGFSSKKIDFNKLISQILMIDNVYAVEPTSKTDYGDYILSKYAINYSDISVQPTSSTYYNEEYVYNLFNNVMEKSGLNYDFIDYSNVFIKYRSSSYKTYSYYFSSSDFTGSTSKLYSNGPVISLEIINNGSISLYTYTYDEGITSANMILYSGSLSNTVYSSTTSNISVTNKLDFSKYKVVLKYNENLFKDNPNFKEVCVPNNKDFAISSNNYELNEDESSEYYGTKSYTSYEFIWFPYYPKGLVSYLYDNSKTNNVWIPEENDTYFDLHPIFHYWLDGKEEIDRVWNLDDPGNTFKSLGYTDKYSYFGWYAHPFVVRYANSGLRQFSIFKFNDDFEFYSTLENGLDYFEKLEEARNGNICFYIRKDFDVNLLNTDEFGDQYGDITIMEDEKLEISTSTNISNLDSKGLFEKVKLFLNEMTDSIDFVKDYIFDLYDSMPYLLKLFIISVFGLIVIKILIGMVVK